jgi:hypothetical protein
MQFPRSRFLYIAAIAAGFLAIASCDQSTASNPPDPSTEAAALVMAVSQPSFSPGAGTFTAATNVTLKTSTSGATIYYTIDGTTPTTKSTKYAVPIALSTSHTIKAIAVKSGSNNSSVSSAVYTIQLTAAAPTFSPSAGTYAVAQTLTLRSTTAGATIYYTTNGTAPTTASTAYTAPFTVGASETIKAIAAAKGYTNSPVASSSYTLNLLSPTTITGAGNSLTGSVTATLKANQPGALLSYSKDKIHWASYPNTGIPVTSSEILYAKDSLSGVALVDSAVFLFAPVITPLSGGYTSAQTVNIKDSGATIRYYLGYSKPSTLTAYTAPLSINACTVLHAVATLGGATSNPVVATYAFPPTVLPGYGTFTDKKSVSISAAGADSLQVSMDGASWASASATFTVTKSGTYYFRSAINGVFSPSSTGSYSIIHDTTLSSVSIRAVSYTLNPPFSGHVYSIGTDSLPFGTSSATVTAVPNDTGARVTINGGTSGVVALINDTVTVSIKVTNGSSTQTYTLPLYAHRSGTFTDSRDGQIYSKVHIGSQVWMAQNLNWDGGDGSLGLCYDGNPANCATFGHLYRWHEAMGLPISTDSNTVSPTEPAQGICPTGWHMPSNAELNTLLNTTCPNYVGGPISGYLACVPADASTPSAPPGVRPGGRWRWRSPCRSWRRGGSVVRGAGATRNCRPRWGRSLRARCLPGRAAVRADDR